jgi:hypothetical protein
MIENGISDLIVILIPYSPLTAFITLTYASDIHILLSVINTIRLSLAHSEAQLLRTQMLLT